MFKIRKYKKGDEIEILKLDRLVETHKWNRRNLKNWYWKYKGRKPGGKTNIFVCEYKNKVIATFSTIPLRYNFKKKNIIVANSIAMIVHPKYQDKGIMKFLGDKLLDETKKKAKFVFGYPNDRSYNLHKIFYDYKDVFQQKLYEIKSNKITNLKLPKNLNLKKIKKFNNRFDLLFKKNINKYSIQVVRDSEYLNWRYIARPDIKYKCFEINYKSKFIGYVVFKFYRFKKKLYGHIIDYYTDASMNKKMENFFISCLYYLKKNKVNFISLWCNGDNSSLSILKKLGFKIVSSRPFICKIFDKKFNNALKNKSWFFTMGDSLEIY